MLSDDEAIARQRKGRLLEADLGERTLSWFQRVLSEQNGMAHQLRGADV